MRLDEYLYKQYREIGALTDLLELKYGEQWCELMTETEKNLVNDVMHLFIIYLDEYCKTKSEEDREGAYTRERTERAGGPLSATARRRESTAGSVPPQRPGRRP